jgi:hypothetical protein
MPPVLVLGNISQSISYRWAKYIHECYCSYCRQKKTCPTAFLSRLLFSTAGHPAVVVSQFSRARIACYPRRQWIPAHGLRLSGAQFSPRASLSRSRARAPLVVLLFFFPSRAASSRHLCVPLSTMWIPSSSSESCRGTMSQAQSEADMMSASHGHGDPNSSELHSFPIFLVASGWEQ